MSEDERLGIFNPWLRTTFMPFTERANKGLRQAVPTEHSQLMSENTILPVLLAEAHEHRAFAASAYVRAKEAKEKTTHMQLWAREYAIGLCETIRERLNAVARMLKVLDTEK